MNEDWLYSEDRMSLREQCLSVLLQKYEATLSKIPALLPYLTHGKNFETLSGYRVFDGTLAKSLRRPQ